MFTDLVTCLYFVAAVLVGQIFANIHLCPCVFCYLLRTVSSGMWSWILKCPIPKSQETTKNTYTFDKNFKYYSYSEKPADLNMEMTTRTHGIEKCFDLVTTEIDNNIINTKHCMNKTAAKREESDEETPVDILNELFQYSDAITHSLNDYNDISYDLLNQTNDRNLKVSKMTQNKFAYNRNVSKMMSNEKSKAKENQDDTSETSSVEDVDGSLIIYNTTIATSTENYDGEIIKFLLPSQNLSVSINDTKGIQLKYRNTLSNKTMYSQSINYKETNPKYKNYTNYSTKQTFVKISNNKKKNYNSELLKNRISNKASTDKNKAVSNNGMLLTPFGLKEPVKKVDNQTLKINNILLNILSERAQSNESTVHNDKVAVPLDSEANSVEQKNQMRTHKKIKNREKAKKKSKTKQKDRKTKLNKKIANKIIVQSKDENTSLENKNFTRQTYRKVITKTNNTVSQETTISNSVIDEEEIKTQNDKGLTTALQTCDNYAKVLYSNKIKSIIIGKTEDPNPKNDELLVSEISTEENRKNTKTIEVYEDYVKRLVPKKFKVNMTQKIDEIENKMKDIPAMENTYEVIANCGIVGSNLMTEEGLTSIENFPWLGVLCYRESKNMRRFTNVILVTRNMVIASALDIYKIPKAYFRQRSKVVLGYPCNYGPGIRVLNYNYHSEYGKTTYSSIALVQLDVAPVEKVLHPICDTPIKLMKPKFFAIVLPDVCKETSVNVYEMNLLDLNLCRSYYNGIGLITDSVWPKHALCGVALHRNGCLWRNGVALVSKQDHSWHLMGFGVNGPGCGAPSRYLNYSVYRAWVAGSAARIGRPAITRLADNHLILRRSNHLLQRHGPCDPWEKHSVLYTNHYETTKYDDGQGGQDPIKKSGDFQYNITLHPRYDYTCIDIQSSSSYKTPLITLKRHYKDQYDFNRIDLIKYSLKVHFSKALDIVITAYGKKNRK